MLKISALLSKVTGQKEGGVVFLIIITHFYLAERLMKVRKQKEVKTLTLIIVASSALTQL